MGVNFVKSGGSNSVQGNYSGYYLTLGQNDQIQSGKKGNVSSYIGRSKSKDIYKIYLEPVGDSEVYYPTYCGSDSTN